MPPVNNIYTLPPELILGERLNHRIPEADQKRQRMEVAEILDRLRRQPGIILADEVGMGKTFVALAVAYSVAVNSHHGPAIIMIPSNLAGKWEQDLHSFCELYLEGRHPLRKGSTASAKTPRSSVFRYGVALHSVELMKFLDDPPRERCHIIFLPHGAMARRQTDKWIRLALIAEALRRHGRGQAARLIEVKRHIHRFLGELLWAIGEERAHDWGQNLWQHLLKSDPSAWKRIYNGLVSDDQRQLTDDPVPKSVTRAFNRLDFAPLAEALKRMPVRARGGKERIAERLRDARGALRRVEEDLWKKVLAEAHWRSPLLVMDEAHHLKNSDTYLARQLQSAGSQRDLRTGDGAMARVFDRMLFLTATPFQLGHHELLNVLNRFGDVRWDSNEFGDQKDFHQRLENLGEKLNDSQHRAIALQRSWSRLRPEDLGSDVTAGWERLLGTPPELLNDYQRAVADAYNMARRSRVEAQDALKPWLIRHNKGVFWAGTTIVRRQRVEGACIAEPHASSGLTILPNQLLPFFLAARSAVSPGKEYPFLPEYSCLQRSHGRGS